RIQGEALANILLVKAVISNDVHLADFRAFAFLHVDADANGIIGTLLHVRIDDHGVLAAVVILLPKKLLHVVQHGTVKRSSASEPHVTQGIHEVFGLDVLVALDGEVLDRRPLLHSDDQGTAITAHLDIVEHALRVERTNDFLDLASIKELADDDRQIVDYSA